MAQPTMKDLNARILELEALAVTQEARITALEAALTKPTKPTGTRDYGPKSKRKTTRFGAYRMGIMMKRGDSVKDIADALGYSRGQVYSFRGGYTWTEVLANCGMEAARK